MSLAMTTEQPPAQKRSLASKGTCWNAHVRDSLEVTLMSCSTTMIPEFAESVCVAKRSDTLHIPHFPISSSIEDLARPHPIAQKALRSIPVLFSDIDVPTNKRCYLGMRRLQNEESKM